MMRFGAWFHLKRVVVALAAPMLVAACAGSTGVTRGSDPSFVAVAPPMPVPSEFNNGAIFQVSRTGGLFTDDKARQVGDILNVRLLERTQASKSTNTSTSKNSNVDVGVGRLFGRELTNLDASLNGSRGSSGQGASAQSNQLDGNITVVVSEVLPNGNLVIQGEKWITINQGEEYIRLRGIVRPVDIRPDNSILSTQIANAQVQYAGRGSLADSNRAGWLTRFFNSPIFPF